MEQENIILKIIKFINNNELYKITFSNFRNKENELNKVIATTLLIKNNLNIQFEYRYSRILTHKNINKLDVEQLNQELKNLFLNAKDINIQTTTENINIKISKKHKMSINKKNIKKIVNISTQNKIKNYLLNENNKYPFLVELGIQSQNGKILKDKYNKFKQINKYLEFIDSAIKELNKENEIKILDFGSGKSYLTFAVYYYLTNILNIKTHIIGIDLKKEVIDNCNSIAKKLNFNKLQFVYGDVKNFDIADNVDIVISLHACDTATDIAILKSISWNAKVILAVPCCQKEINKQLKSNSLPFMLKHGIIKEKFATLLTESIRSEVLEAFGYKSNIIEFISEENTPKNMLIRAYKIKNNIDYNKLEQIENNLKNFNIKMMLVDEIKNKYSK